MKLVYILEEHHLMLYELLGSHAKEQDLAHQE